MIVKKVQIIAKESVQKFYTGMNLGPLQWGRNIGGGLILYKFRAVYKHKKWGYRHSMKIAKDNIQNI